MNRAGAGRSSYKLPEICDGFVLLGDDRVDLKSALFHKQHSRCWICGTVMRLHSIADDSLLATLDHVVPRVHGGTNDESNLRLAHLYCNSVRGDGRLHRRFATLLLSVGEGKWPPEVLYPMDQDRTLLDALRPFYERWRSVERTDLMPFTAAWLRNRGYATPLCAPDSGMFREQS